MSSRPKRSGAKAAVVILSMLLFLIIFTSTAFAAVPGDVNEDGVINVQDVSLVMRSILNLETLTQTQKALADVNGDGVVDVQDVTLIMQKTLGLIDEFPDVRLSVTAVKADNLREIEITFNRILTTQQKAEVIKFSNIRVYRQGDMVNDIFTPGNRAGARVLDDGRTVRVTLKDNQHLVNFTTANRVVVKKAVGLESDYVKSDLAVSDTTVPRAEGVQVVGPRNLIVTFSEPVKGIAPERFSISEGAYLATSAQLHEKDPRKVEITVGVNLSEGSHTIYVGATAGIEDHAGLPLTPRIFSFNVVRDTNPPQVSAVSATPNEIVIAFDKPVLNVKDNNVRYRHTFNTSLNEKRGDAANFITPLADNRYRLNYAGMPLSPGDNVLYINYASAAANKITDYWGNELPATSLSLKVTMDTTRPEVTEVEFVDSSTIEVKFNKEVELASSQNTNNYTVRDAANRVVPLVSATRGAGENTHVVTLKFGPDAIDQINYTINIRNIRDTAFIPNTMTEVTIPFTAVDTVPPTAGDKAYFSAATRKVMITFSEPMRTSGDGSIADKANYQYTPTVGAARPLGVNDSISVAADAKSVILTISTDQLQSSDKIRVHGVRDVAGNLLKDFFKEYTGLSLQPDKVEIEKVEAISRNRLKVTFDARLSEVTATGYRLHLANGGDTGISLTVASHDTITTTAGVRKSVVEFVIGENLNYDATRNVAGSPSLQLVIDNATGTRSILGNQVTNIGTGLSPRDNDVLDKIPPAVHSVTRIDVNTIRVRLTEDIDPDTVSLTGVNGFSVAGDNVTLTKATRTAARDITLEGTNFTVNTDVHYNEAAGITDLAGNRLPSFSRTSPLSTP